MSDLAGVESESTHGYFLKDERDEIARRWETYKGYTVRPVESTERCYQRWIENIAAKLNGKMETMIYGGTPEIRNCINRIGATATLVDRSELMINAMGLLTEHGQPLSTQEKFVEADWLNIPLADNSFDVLIGDDAINMVDWSEFESYLIEASRLLRPGGSMLCHLLVKPPENLINRHVSEVIADRKSNRISSVYEYASEINFVHYNYSTYRMGWQASIAGIEREQKAGTISDDEGFCQFFQSFNSSFACPPQDEFEKLLSSLPGVEIEEIFYPAEYNYCKYEPLYHLKMNTKGEQ